MRAIDCMTAVLSAPRGVDSSLDEVACVRPLARSKIVTSVKVPPMSTPMIAGIVTTVPLARAAARACPPHSRGTLEVAPLQPSPSNEGDRRAKRAGGRLDCASCEGQEPFGVVDEDRLNLGFAEAAPTHHRHDVAEYVAIAVAAEGARAAC